MVTVEDFPLCSQMPITGLQVKQPHSSWGSWLVTQKKIVVQNECNILVIMVTPNFCFVGPRYFHPVEDKVKTPLLIISSYLALEA